MPAVQKADGIHQEDSMARVVRFHETGGPEVLKIEEIDVPPPGKGEVQIGVKALAPRRPPSARPSASHLNLTADDPHPPRLDATPFETAARRSLHEGISHAG
jgi:hypothetical protein